MKRTLNQDLIQQLMQDTMDRKMSIQTLHEVLVAFSSAFDRAILNYDFTKFDQHSVIFPYEGRNWKGTITKQNAVYCNKPVQVINIKLPNDSFIYSSKYVADPTKATIVDTQETANFAADVGALVPFPNGTFDLKLDDQWMEFQFEDSPPSDPNAPTKMFTLKFKYGSYENFTSTQKLSRAHLMELVKQLNK